MTPDSGRSDRIGFQSQLKQWFQDHADLGTGSFLTCPQCGSPSYARWRGGRLQVTVKVTCEDNGHSDDVRVWPEWRGLDDYPAQDKTNWPLWEGRKSMDIDAILNENLARDASDDEFHQDDKDSIREEGE